MDIADFPNLTVLEHPLIQHKLAILRDKSTPVKDFKQLVNEIAMLMTYEVTRNLATETVEIETPLERTSARKVSGKKLTLVPILRAGLGLVEGITQLIPSARVGHVGLFRDHEAGFVQRFHAAHAAGDGTAAARAAHDLKGEAGTLGMPALQEAATALEQACLEGASGAEVYDLLHKVSMQLDEVFNELLALEPARSS